MTRACVLRLRMNVMLPLTLLHVNVMEEIHACQEVPVRRLKREHLRVLACLMTIASSMALATLVISFRVLPFVDAVMDLVVDRTPNVSTELVWYECSYIDYTYMYINITNGDRMVVMLISNFLLGGPNYNNGGGN